MNRPLGNRGAKAAPPAPGSGADKSWQTSHLPRLRAAEIDGVLQLMRGWYVGREFSFAKDCNWPIMWEYIDRNGLGGILGAAVIDDLCQVPQAIGQAAEHRYFSTQMHYEQARRCCLQVAGIAAELGIGLRVMKGPALVVQGYDDPGVRAFSDIDIFIADPGGVEKLRRALAGVHPRASVHEGLWARFGESERTGFFVGDWELEFRYPVDPPGEPMFEFLAAHGHRLFLVPGEPAEILQPDPSLHLVFLLQHMAVHHLFSRFFWFLDLAVLVRKSGDRIDLAFVAEEVRRLGLGNCAAAAARFCREHLEPQFPELSKPLPCWNTAMITNFTVPGHIAAGRYGIYHRRARDRAFAYLVGMTSFYLLADPVHGALFGFGTTWSLNRFRYAFGVLQPIKWVDFLLRPVLALVLLPLAMLLTMMETRKVGRSKP